MANVKPEASTKDEPDTSNQQENHGDSHNFGRGRGRGGFRGGFNNRRGGPFNPRGGGRGGGNFNRPPRDGPPGQNQNDQGGPMGPRGQMDKIMEKLSNLSGPSYDIPPLEITEKMFSGRTRLYVGNINTDVDEESLKDLFKPFGETSEYFINKEKNFAFVKVDYRANAEKAKRELDGVLFKGKNVKIRFAPTNSTIKVKNLTPFVTNELLYFSFSVFGEIERAYVIVDERGKPTGEGIVEFSRKNCALHAIRKCSEGCFFLTSSLRPCIVEAFEGNDDTDGHPEKNLKRNHEFGKSREIGPRFANPNSFEHEYGMRWKQLHELFSGKEVALRKEYEMEKEKLDAQMEYARYEHETELLRDQLRVREMDRDRQKHEWEKKERMAEEQRQRNEEQMRRQQDDMQSRMLHQDEELRRRKQENNLFLQAHQLDNMLDQEEKAYDQPNNLFNNMNNDNDGSPVLEPKAFLNSYKRNNQRFDGRGEMGPNGPRNGGGGGRGHWVNNDNFPPKRRRF